MTVFVFTIACNQTPPTESYKESITLEVGDCTYISASEGFWAEYDYKSSDESVATVSNTGIISAIKEGTSVVTAKRGDVVVYEYTVTVTANTYVAPPVVDNSSYRIVLDKTEGVVYVGGAIDLKVEVYKDDTLVNEIPTFEIEGSSIEIEPIADGIKIKGVSVGSSSISVKKGGFTAICNIDVYNTSVEYLSAPTITKANATEISWNAVENASTYRLSLNNGADWYETSGTSFAVTDDYNPVQVRVQALPESGLNYAKSSSGFLSATNLEVANGKQIKVLFDKTVAGNDNEVNVDVELELYYNLGGERYKIADKFITWSVENNGVVAVNGTTVSAVELGFAKVTAKVLGGQATNEIAVGIPVSSKADLDAIAFGQKNGDNTVWHKSKNYILTNDIDYMSETWHERYLAPIAVKGSASGTKAPATVAGEQCVFGIYGSEMNRTGADHKDANGAISNGIFYATLDGNGYAIKNAVIPCGTIVAKIGNSIFAGYNNFIGTLAYGGTLKNIAFMNLTFETPSQAAADSYMYNSATNPNLVGTEWESTGIPVANMNEHLSFGTALIGSASNAKIENVYLESKSDYGTYHPKAANGMLVSVIGGDNATNDGQMTELKGCVVESSYYNKDAYLHIMQGAGALVGVNKTQKATTITDCFVISKASTNYQAYSPSRLFVYPDNAISAGISGLESFTSATTNTAVYSDKAGLMSAQSAIADKYDIWQRIVQK